MTQNLAEVAHATATAFNICDSCDKTFPTVYRICSTCGGRLRSEGKIANSSSSTEQPTFPIETIQTNERIIDSLQLQLSIVEEVYGDNIRVRKYQAQAQDLMFNIPMYRPTPHFIISLNDLPESLRKELESLAKVNKRALHYVVKSAVGRIFEAINLEYYTISVARSLVVKIQQ